jgi:uncharacterized protein (TIGR04255 family)
LPAATPLRTGYRFGTAELPQEFAHPPLIEVWLGVEFSAPPDFAAISAAQWRQRLGPEWPASWQLIGAAERHAPGVTQIEHQLRNVMSDRAIRFATEGFSFGWLGYDGNLYPRYEAIRDGFVATLDAIRDVMPHVGTPVRSSITYLNRIPQGTVWTTPSDWTFFKLWQPNPLTKLKISPESFAGSWNFPLDGDRGTLTIELSHESSGEQANLAEALWLRITSSGPTDADESSLFDGLDYGREVIVRAFNELVTPDAKEYWGVNPRK